MSIALQKHLQKLAEKYERIDFIDGDPSWFMHQVDDDLDKEILAFIASSLSYGSRAQFLKKINYLFDHALRTDGKNSSDENRGFMSRWLLSGRFNEAVPLDGKCFYRLYTNEMMNMFLRTTRDIVAEYGSLKECVAQQQINHTCLEAVQIITKEYRERGSKGIIPQDASSSCKRVCMFLRWMVRKDSPVDIGLWSDIIDQRSLIIPMDTHVVQEAMKLELITSRTTSMSNALRLSRKLAEIFPDDPLKGDFALFGYGVDKNNA